MNDELLKPNNNFKPCINTLRVILANWLVELIPILGQKETSMVDHYCNSLPSDRCIHRADPCE